MSRVIFGRYPLPPYESPVEYIADAFWEPNYGVFGIAASDHPYSFFPISERDVHTAFDLVCNGLAKYGSKLNNIELLCSLLQVVHQGFGKIDIHTHIAGLELAHPLPEIANRQESMPRVQIILLKLEGRQLSIARVGNVFSVYMVRPTGQELIFGIDPITGMHIPDGVRYPGNFIIGHADIPEIYSLQTEVEPGTFIVTTNITLGRNVGEFIHQSKLDELLKTTACNPEIADQYLRSLLKPPKKPGYTQPGLAWAITCVEE